MKKIIVLILTIVLVVSLSSCELLFGAQHECENICPDCGLCMNEYCTETVCANKCECKVEVKESVYEVLTRLTKEKYSRVSIYVTTNTGGLNLTAKYYVSANLVEYEIEQLNKLPEDGNLEGASSSYKSTFKGKAEIKNGQVVRLDGESVALPDSGHLKGAFNFTESNFKNVNTSAKGTFKADVVSPSKFMGTNTDAKNMKVVVEYSDTALKTITITYDTDYSNVKLSYKFTK
jgi:hypothetical protein